MPRRMVASDLNGKDIYRHTKKCLLLLLSSVCTYSVNVRFFCPFREKKQPENVKLTEEGQEKQQQHIYV